MIQLSIGGNNFGFADIVQRCVTNFLTSPSWWPNYCYDDSAVTSNFPAANVTNQTNAIIGAITNIRTAMTNAGYTPAQYTIVTQTYPSPIPRGSGFRYSQSGFTRQSTGGCGFWNRDADWANDTALVKINDAVKNAAAAANAASGNVKVMDVAASFNGRRLCEIGVNLMENTRPGELDRRRRGRHHRVDRPDPHAQHRVRSVLRAGVDPSELVGREGAAQLRAPGVQQRGPARRYLRQGHRPERQRRAQHDPALSRSEPLCAALNPPTRPTSRTRTRGPARRAGRWVRRRCGRPGSRRH